MSDKQKYWLLTSEFPPLHGGGISTYCLHTANMLQQAGYDVVIFTQDFAVSGNQIKKENGIAVVRFNPDSSSVHKSLGYEANLSFSFYENVSQFIEKMGAPDYIEMQDYQGIGYYLLQHRLIREESLQKIKMILTLHAPSFIYLPFNQVPYYQYPDYWTGEMEKFCIRAADYCISPSKYLADLLPDYLKTDDLKINVVPNPYEIDMAEEHKNINRGEFVFFGKFTPQKGCIELLSYCRKLWQKGLGFKLRMIGGGNHLFYPLNKDLKHYLGEQYSAEIKAGKLEFCDQILPEQIEQIIGSAHAVIIPSIVDNLPYTVLETMNIGKVLLVSRQGGQSEVINDGVNGFIFDHDRPDSFENKIQQLLSLNEKELQVIGERARETIGSGYSYKVVIDRKKEVLFKVPDEQIRNNYPLIRPDVPEKEWQSFQLANGLSVVVPYFNMGKYLDECMNSLFSSEEVTEIIIVNDGSKDRQSISKLDQYRSNSLVKIVDVENGGLASARNIGAGLAKGDFLAFLDPDDSVDKRYYSTAIQILRKYDNISFVGCWSKYFGENDDVWPAFNPEPPYVLLHNCMNTSAMVYKKQHFLNSGSNDPEMIYGMEDYDSMLSMIEAGYHGVAIPKPWWNYRIRSNSMAQSFTLNSKLYLYDKIAKKHTSLYNKFATELFMLLNSNGPSVNIDNPTFRVNILGIFDRNPRMRKLKSLIKKNRLLRKVAVRVYNKINK